MQVTEQWPDINGLALKVIKPTIPEEDTLIKVSSVYVIGLHVTLVEEPKQRMKIQFRAIIQNQVQAIDNNQQGMRDRDLVTNMNPGLRAIIHDETALVTYVQHACLKWMPPSWCSLLPQTQLFR